MKKFTYLLAAGFLAATAGWASAADPEFVFKFQHQLGPKSPAQVRMIEPWAKKVEELSNGRIKIEIYPSMALGGTPPQSFKYVVDGVADMTWTVNGYTPGLFPRTEVFELPNVFNGNIAATNLAMREMFDKYLSEDFKDVHVLFLHAHGGQAIQMASKLVRSPADLKGLKIRIPGPTGKAVIEALGATPVGMPIPDLPQRLATHEVDGAMIPWEPIPAFKLQDFLKYFIEGPNEGRFGTTTFQVTMNKAKWDALPADFKVIIEKRAAELADESAKIREEMEGVSKKKIIADPRFTTVTLSADQRDSMERVISPAIQDWKTSMTKLGIDGDKLYKRARELVQQSKVAAK